jgi:integrase
LSTATKRARVRGNGQGTAFKRGGTWMAQCTVSIEKDDNGKIVKRNYKSKGGFKTKREALAYIPQLLEQPAGINPSITFAKLYDLWSEQHFDKVSKSTSDGYRAAYAKCGALYNRQFAQLKAADLQKVVDECEMSRRTKADIKSLFSNMYRYAIQNDYIDKNYAEFVKLPKKPKSKKDAFTAEERKTLWKAYNGGNKFVGHILVMIYTGMRYGEYSIVTKENVNLKEKYIVGGIKTDAGINRVIPLADCIIPIVKELYEQGEKKLLEIPEKKWYSTYYFVLEQLGIRRLNPHCCRHTTATALAAANVPPAVITAIMGHEDYSTTLIYTHMPLNDLLSAINKI